MPRSYWLPVVAAVGLTVSVGVGWILQPKKPNLPGERGYHEYSAAYRAGGAGCEPQRIDLLRRRERQRKEDACADGKEQHREAANSFIETRRAADAADATAILAYQQTRVFAWGAAIALFTLFAAAVAAIYAKKTADIAHKALVDLERPWIFVDIKSGIERGPDGEPAHIIFDISNHGRMPAMITSLLAGISTGNIPDYPSFVVPNPGNIGPDKKWTGSKVFIPDGIALERINGKLEPLLRPAEYLFFRILILYDDVSGSTHVTAMCRRLDLVNYRWVKFGGEELNHQT